MTTSTNPSVIEKVVEAIISNVTFTVNQTKGRSVEDSKIILSYMLTALFMIQRNRIIAATTIITTKTTVTTTVVPGYHYYYYYYENVENSNPTSVVCKIKL